LMEYRQGFMGWIFTSKVFSEARLSSKRQ